MDNLNSFSRWTVGLGCILIVAALGCGDSGERGTGVSDGGLDGAVAVDGKAARIDTATLDGAQVDGRAGNDSEVADRGGTVEADADAIGDRDSGGGPGLDAAVTPNLDAGLDVALRADVVSTFVDAEPPIDTTDTIDTNNGDTQAGIASADGNSGLDAGGADGNDASINTGGTGGSVDFDGGNNVDTGRLDVAVEMDSGFDGSTDAGSVVDTGVTAGYAVQGDYLRNPDLAKAMLKSLADFRVRARDTVNGGSFTYANVDGTVSADHRKSFVSETRDAWAFSRAFMVTGDETYLDYAAQELDFLYAHGWDSTNGGWYFIADEQGSPTELWPGYNPNTFKGAFIQHYALLGIGALCDATRDDSTCAWFQKGRRFLDEKMWDANPSALGYYDYGSLDLTTVHSKGFTATADAMTTHALQSVLLWPTNQAYQQRLLDLANIVADRLAANIDLPMAKFGFPENYNTDWTVDTAQTAGYVGHVLKSAWVLARTYLRHPDVHYRDAARKLIYEVLNNGGWDDVHGVPYTNTNWSTGAQDTTQAECWEIQQAVMSGLANWYISDNQADKDTYLKMADRALSFFVANVVDPVYGGTWKMNYVDGAPKGNSKSNEYNVEYHSTETFYFTYLYGNLMLQHRPVTLYYRVSPLPNQRTIQLNPVSIDDASLQIQSVTLNGAPLATFSGSTREVTLADNQGGKLAVVFGRGP